MITDDFVMGFIGINSFNKEARKQFQEKWSKMTDSEKLEFMNKKVESVGHDRFSIETINAYCEEWWMKSSEEKQIFVDELNQAFEEKMSRNGCFGDKRFGI